MKRHTCALLIAMALCICMFGASAHAQTITSGILYFTTFQNQGEGAVSTNVWSVPYDYDLTFGLCLGSQTLPCPLSPTPTAIANLVGADGILLDPNDPTNKTLLVGEQIANQVAQVSTDGLSITEKPANQAVPAGAVASLLVANAQAFALTAKPDKTTLVSLPNYAVALGSNINLSPIGPLGNGTAQTITGPDTVLVGMAFDGAGNAFYGTAPDFLTGDFGSLNFSTFVTTQSTIIDDVNPGTPAGQGALPSHGVAYDSFSGCFFLSAGALIWQLCPDASLANTFHIVAKITPSQPGCSPSQTNNCQNNWDQTVPDGQGHLFAANNDGNVFFVDYSKSATKNIGDAANYTNAQFLQVALDDFAIAPTQNIPGRMTGGGSVFTTAPVAPVGGAAPVPAGTRVTHGFELHCEIEDVPNRLEINWAGHRFHLTTLTFAFCFKDPSIDAGHPTNIFNTYVGQGTGLLDGAPGATATWIFTDAGEPGTNDTATITIKDSLSNVVLTVSGKLDNGNQQAHTDNK